MILEDIKPRFSSTYRAYLYAKNMEGGRYEPSEEFILGMRDVKLAYHYAKDVVEGAWPEAEELIMSEPFYACQYAEHVLKGKWEEGEDVILQSERVRGRYNEFLRSIGEKAI